MPCATRLSVIAGIGLVIGTGALGLNIGWADNILHLAVAVVLTGVGYGMRSAGMNVSIRL